MSESAAVLARRLARDPEAVCRHYLPNGRRRGRYWVVGDVRNTPGRSLYVRLAGADSGPGAAGKWTDAATGEHGDLLDLIARNRGLSTLRDVLNEARRFLSMPDQAPLAQAVEWTQAKRSRAAARRLFRAGIPVPGTHAEAYLRARGITAQLDYPCLKFHPSLWYRADEDATPQSWPGLLAAVTDAEGRITGVQRTWLDPERPAKAPVADPRRALGQLLGHGVRFGDAGAVLVAGEGVETMLALKSVLPDLPMIAALSAHHLGALALSPHLTRLYIACEVDPAGEMAAARLHRRGWEAGVAVHDLVPLGSDFNADLKELGPDLLLSLLVPQLAPEDVARFVRPLMGL
jgi:hypothetical protein